GDGFDDLIIGAHEYDNPQKNEGRVWLHRGSISGVEPIADWNFETNRKGAKGGESVSIVDDVNNDGFDDVVIGARGWDNDEELGDLGDKAGKFWVYLGSASGLGAIAHMECVGQVEDAELGVSTDGAGDVNGDGYNDINIGGYIFLIGDGMICTFHGGEGGPDNIPDFMAIGGANDTSFYAVNLSNAGDINGDGYSDVVIGMPRYDTYGVYNAGKMRYHLGSDLGLDTTKYDLFGEGQYNERWAFNVNDAGDLNKDGYDDILLTAKNYAPPGSGLEDSVGRGYMFLGSPHGLAEKATWTFDGESVSGVGTNIALAGDVNGDSLSDIILSGDGYSGSYTQEGAVYIFHGIEQVCDPASSFTSIGVGSTTATFTWDWVYGSYSYKVYLNRIGVPGPPMVMTTESNSITVTGLVPGATYKCYVKTQCQAGWTGRSNFKTINTTPTTGIDAGENNSEVKLYPNPVTNILNIETGVLLGETNIRIYDAKGEVVMSKSYNLESVNKTLQLEDMSSLPEGFYFVEIQNNNASVVRKISKTK
ncbi:MAG: FG-GAP repeat protein, partial [Fimbriimonadaceae bacterium]|nr:FG-GAP repeat protein [Chitinophagales bacterium]